MADISLPQSREYYRVKFDNGTYAHNVDAASLLHALEYGPRTIMTIEHVSIDVTVVDVTEVFLQ